MSGVGRVFFWPPGAARLEQIAFQPLENHRQNVEFLLRAWTWEGDFALNERTWDWLCEAVSQHDWGKRSTLRILPPGKEIRGRSQTGWNYSFAGHRFRLLGALSAYARAIERAHNDYSTAEIARAGYALVEQHGIDRNTVQERYARDLYIYCMCDQIEAELAVRVWAEKARETAFLSFILQPLAGLQGIPQRPFPFGTGPLVFTLDPFPFEKSVELILRYRFPKLPPEWERLGSPEVRARALEALSFDLDEAPEVPVTVRLEPAVAELEGVETDLKAFYQAAVGFSPNSLQREVWQKLQNGQDALVLLAPTGSGKTEAVALPLLACRRRVVIALPAKSLLEDHLVRFERILTRLSGALGFTHRLIVDTGDRMEHRIFEQGNVRPLKGRHLYRGDVILTTLDKLLYRYFGYDPERKSYTYPLRLGQLSTAFIFDEAHTYESTAFTNFARLLEALYLRGHPLVAMIATLPTSYLEALGQGFAFVDYAQGEQALTLEQEMGRGEYAGRRRLRLIGETGGLEDLEAHKAARRKAMLVQLSEVWTGQERVLLSLDRVKDAALLYQTLREKPPHGIQPLSEPTSQALSRSNLLLYHGRLDPEWRRWIYQRVQKLDQEGKPYLLVSTSAIEVGVDLNATHLITEICAPEALVHRAGRVNRRGTVAEAEVRVIGRSIPAYLDPFREDQAAFERYLECLEHLEALGPEEARQFMAVYARPILRDPRAEVAFTLLSRYVYEYRLEYEPLHQQGFIATRSWEPTLTVVVNEAEGWEMEVPVRRLSYGPKQEHLAPRLEEAQHWRLEVYRASHNADHSWQGRWERLSTWGDLYRGRYRMVFQGPWAEAYRRDEGLVNPPRIFRRERWSSDPPLKVRLRTWLYEGEEGGKEIMWFPADSLGKGKSKRQGRMIILHYLADPGLEET